MYLFMRLFSHDKISDVAGVERYKIQKVVQKHPILIAEVEMMPDEDDNTPKVALLLCAQSFGWAAAAASNPDVRLHEI